MKIFVISVAVHAHYGLGGQGIAIVSANTPRIAKALAALESTGWGDWTIQEAIDSAEVLSVIESILVPTSAEEHVVSYAFTENAWQTTS